MFIASYEKTQASASFKPKLSDGIRRFDINEARRIRAEQEKARQAEILARQRAEANALIAKGRAVALQFRIDEEMEQSRHFRHSYGLIERRICKVFKISRTELHSRRQDKAIVLARQAVTYWACRLTLCSLTEIGRALGGRDHSTSHHNRNVYPKRRAEMGRTLRSVK